MAITVAAMKRWLVSFLLVGGGATLVLSATLNLVGAWILLEPSDEVALGISRGEVWRWFGASLAAGLLMIGWGVRVGRRSLRAAAES